MTWLSVLSTILWIAKWIAKKAGQREVEEAVLNGLEILHSKRARAAADARAAVAARGMPDIKDDPHNRDRGQDSGPGL